MYAENYGLTLLIYDHFGGKRGVDYHTQVLNSFNVATGGCVGRPPGSAYLRMFGVMVGTRSYLLYTIRMATNGLLCMFAL